MKVLLVPPSISTNSQPAPYLSSYIIDDTLAVDAGCLGFYGTPAEQERITHLFLSHTHLDHVASLPILLENLYDPPRPPITILGSQDVLDSLQRDFFNGRVWPDFFALGAPDAPFARKQVLRAHEPVSVAKLKITPIPVNHVVPTFGFAIEGAGSAIVIVSDTAATEEIWKVANRLANLKAVFLEASFPDSMNSVAEAAKHMTTSAFGTEVRKLKRPAPVIAVHIKARYYAEIVKELEALGLPQVQIARYGEAMSF